ncbi:hypothetical protein ACHAXS_012424 [Conticribra weissflogii]
MVSSTVVMLPDFDASAFGCTDPGDLIIPPSIAQVVAIIRFRMEVRIFSINSTVAVIESAFNALFIILDVDDIATFSSFHEGYGQRPLAVFGITRLIFGGLC